MDFIWKAISNPNLYENGFDSGEEKEEEEDGHREKRQAGGGRRRNGGGRKNRKDNKKNAGNFRQFRIPQIDIPFR